MTEEDINSIYPNPENPRATEPLKPKNKFPLGIIFKFLIYALFIVLIIYIFINWNDYKPYYDKIVLESNQILKDFKNISTPTPSKSLVLTDNWQTFDNSTYCYRVFYPNEWVYYRLESPSMQVASDWYKETVGFQPGPKSDSKNFSGDIRITSFAENFESTIKDVKSATEDKNIGPNKLVEEKDIVINNLNYRKLTYARFSSISSSYDNKDLLIYYITSGTKYSYLITIIPYPKYLPIDQKILENFNPSSC